jgi:hypothetical protein
MVGVRQVGVERLVVVAVQHVQRSPTEELLGALASMCEGHAANQSLFEQHCMIEALAALLTSPDAAIRNRACVTLGTVCAAHPGNLARARDLVPCFPSTPSRCCRCESLTERPQDLVRTAGRLLRDMDCRNMAAMLLAALCDGVPQNQMQVRRQRFAFCEKDELTRHRQQRQCPSWSRCLRAHTMTRSCSARVLLVTPSLLTLAYAGKSMPRRPCGRWWQPTRP